jgi:uncharacterized protein YecE (DUF72 family)
MALRGPGARVMGLRLGTSSWGEKGWVGTFYPPGTPALEFLGHYASRFGTVEADNTYYRVPSAKTVLGWEGRVPHGFTLCAKFPRAVVHGGAGPRPDAAAILDGPEACVTRDLFLKRMQLMGAKLGPLLVQFPYFNRSAFAEPGPFLERLNRFLEDLPGDFRYAVEIRNRHWVGQPLLDILRGQRVAWVWVDLPYMPAPWEMPQGLAIETADFTYTRLIGDRRATSALTKSFSGTVIDRREELLRWADFLRPVVARPGEHFVFANNHYAGHGPATVCELGALLGLDLGGEGVARQGRLPLGPV